MTEEEKPTEPTRDIDWTKGENIPHDAVQYWGKCLKCGHDSFVHKTAHMCSECIVKVKPKISPSPDVVIPDEPATNIDAEPWEKPPEVQSTFQKPVTKNPESETKKRGRPKGSKKMESKKPKGGFTPRTQVTKITPAKFDGPVGEWIFDDNKKGWVVKDEQGRAVRFSKEKPSEAK